MRCAAWPGAVPWVSAVTSSCRRCARALETLERRRLAAAEPGGRLPASAAGLTDEARHQGAGLARGVAGVGERAARAQHGGGVAHEAGEPRVRGEGRRRGRARRRPRVVSGAAGTPRAPPCRRPRRHSRPAPGPRVHPPAAPRLQPWCASAAGNRRAAGEPPAVPPRPSSSASPLACRACTAAALMLRPPRTPGSRAPSAGSGPAIARGRGGTRPPDSARSAPPSAAHPR